MKNIIDAPGRNPAPGATLQVRLGPRATAALRALAHLDKRQPHDLALFLLSGGIAQLLAAHAPEGPDDPLRWSEAQAEAANKLFYAPYIGGVGDWLRFWSTPGTVAVQRSFSGDSKAVLQSIVGELPE